ncbi:ribonuclease H-like domain-containing protein [Tanacetum coccineum]
MVERDDEITVLGEIKIELKSGTHKVIEKLSQEKVSQQEALEKFKWTVVRDHEIKVLEEVNVELESGSKKQREKLRQEEDIEEQVFKEFSSTLDNVLEKLSQENESPDWNDIAYLLIYAHDIILTASSSDLLKRIISSLHIEFSMTDLGSLNNFLGISMQRTSSDLFLSQTKYSCEVLERAGMMNCNPCKTPADIKHKFGPDGDHISDPSLYRSLAGSLYDNLITWSSKCQYVTSRSSSEVEYRGIANAVFETAWVRNLFHELLVPLRTATLVYYDNVSAVYLSCNPVQHQHTKNIEIDIHFVHDFIATGHVCVLHVPS